MKQTDAPGEGRCLPFQVSQWLGPDRVQLPPPRRVEFPSFIILRTTQVWIRLMTYRARSSWLDSCDQKGSPACFSGRGGVSTRESRGVDDQDGGWLVFPQRSMACWFWPVISRLKMHEYPSGRLVTRSQGASVPKMRREPRSHRLGPSPSRRVGAGYGVLGSERRASRG